MNPEPVFDGGSLPEEMPYIPEPEPKETYRADRTPPHDVDAEMGVLGSMMLSSQAIVDIVGTLSEDSFYRVSHQLIFRAIVDLFSDNKQVDALLVANLLRRKGELDQVGGPAYLHTLMHSVPTAANAVYYAEIVAEKAILRGLVNAGTKVVQLGYEGLEGAEIDGVLDSAQQAVFAVGRGSQEDDYQVLGDLINPVWDELDALTRSGGMANGVPTGFADLDKLVNGLHGGQMIIVAARPGVGKSTIAMDFMRSCSIKHKKASILFSLEMSKSEVVQRILAAEASVRLSEMRAGRLKDDQWDKLALCLNQLEDAPLYISDNASMTMMDIRAKARRLAQSVDLGLIVLDYLQLMSSGKRVESRQQEVSEFSRQMKLLAKELDVPVVAISQLNRGPESRNDKKPQLADLRESGSLEQDADMVFLLYRPDSQDPNSDRAGEADVIVAKHRGGPIGTVNLAHQMHYSRFQDLAREPGAAS